MPKKSQEKGEEEEKEGSRKMEKGEWPTIIWKGGRARKEYT